MSKDDRKQTTTETENTETPQGSLEEWEEWAIENIDLWVEAMVNE